jgi:hypothetical protein
MLNRLICLVHYGCTFHSTLFSEQFGSIGKLLEICPDHESLGLKYIRSNLNYVLDCVISNHLSTLEEVPGNVDGEG